MNEGNNILEILYNKYGDFWVSEYYENIDNWSTWKLYSEWKNANSLNKKVLRGVFSDEIVLDIEDKNYEDIKKSLLELDLKFKIYDSGGRGIHIHLFFPEIKNYDESIRPYIKELIIDRLSLGKGDKKKKDNKNLIGLEFYQHRKGNEKILLFETDNEYYPENKLDSETLRYIQTLPEKYDGNLIEGEIKPRIVFKSKKPCDAIKELIGKGVPKGERNKYANFIVQQLRDYCGYDINECFEAINEYNKNCLEPKEESKIRRDLIEQYKRRYNINCNTLGNYCKWKNKKDCPQFKYFNGKANREVYINIDTKEPKTKKEIILPTTGKSISVFAEELAEILKDKNTIFYRPDSKDIVEIGRLKLHKTGEEIFTGFISVKPNRFITLIEKYASIGVYTLNQDTRIYEFKEKSLSSEVANTVLSSHILQQALPQITRIFTIPLPIMYEGDLTFPKKGYDIRFSSWLPYNSPEISNPDMNLEEAKGVIERMFKEFCFETKQDYINAIAGLLTPFLRGLFTTFNTRTPVFFYLANRERAGKDYLAGITGIVYEGNNLEESPISNSENARSNNTDELRKKVLAAFINGRKRLHFSNNKGYIDNAVLEAVATSEKYSDRLLGKSELLTFDNELDISLSGNVGVGFTPDFANRCRFVRLFLDIENANARSFENPDLHEWVRKNRSLILSAFFSLVKNWINNGSPKGKLPFASFHQWANICGGIMESAGYESPCIPDTDILSLGGDSETQDMKKLFELCYEKNPEKWIFKHDIRSLVMMDDSDLFSYYDFRNNKSDQIKFGNKIIKFIGRVLSDIKLVVRDKAVRASRQEFMFTKEKHEVNKDDIFK